MSSVEEASSVQRGAKPRATHHKWGRSSLSFALASVCFAAGTLGGVACNNPPPFLAAEPAFRGITIPIPPPSYLDDPVLRMDIEGQVPSGFDVDGTQVYLYEKRSDRGYFSYADGADFIVFDVLVDVTDNCMVTWAISGGDDTESTPTHYKAFIEEDPDACAEDSTCSAPDDDGNCVCLAEWKTGC